jgi:hypothetical protein
MTELSLNVGWLEDVEVDVVQDKPIRVWAPRAIEVREGVGNHF